jgi:hypothetical protein
MRLGIPNLRLKVFVLYRVFSIRVPTEADIATRIQIQVIHLGGEGGTGGGMGQGDKEGEKPTQQSDQAEYFSTQAPSCRTSRQRSGMKPQRLLSP